jgi:hypothetical protein
MLLSWISTAAMVCFGGVVFASAQGLFDAGAVTSRND